MVSHRVFNHSNGWTDQYSDGHFVTLGGQIRIVKILDLETCTVPHRKPDTVRLSNSTFDSFQICPAFGPFETRTQMSGFRMASLDRFVMNKIFL
jgi:hypothetical protein